MSQWRCAIGDCNRMFDDGESLVLHQAREHERHQCQVCNTITYDGYIAIRHAFDEHTRAEYVRAYEADSKAVRERERVKEIVEKEVNLRAVFDTLEEE
ncbi:DUF7565 family protein [Natronocalculus amylovorans]|uniref:C2H2-type domain-containing protein n=1 Tax=Natronocalculus amylovorans TaxID=2917812 RepID=A0AAE3K8T6_9EURY|nr:hypothetical protein [Natronocalculus amylovorans]MCL9815324.1 hypothetical protein [Natronocalculus amylovorans]